MKGRFLRYTFIINPGGGGMPRLIGSAAKAYFQASYAKERSCSLNNRLVKWCICIILVALAIMVCYGILFDAARIDSTFRLFIDWIFAILTPLSIAFAVAYLLDPLVCKAQALLSRSPKKRWRKRGLACGLVFLCFIAVIALFLGFALPVIADNAWQLADNFPEYYQSLQDWVSQQAEDTRLGDIPFIQDFINNNLRQTLSNLIQWSSDTLSQIFQVFSGAISGLFNALIYLLIAFYMLLEKDSLLRFCRELTQAVMPKKNLRVRHVVQSAHHILSDYIRSRFIDALIIAALALIGLYILGIPYAALLGLVMAVMNLLPYIGPVIGALPPLIISLFMQPIMAVPVLILVIILQLLDNFLIGPKITSSTMQISPFWVMAGIVLGGGLFGMLGMFFGVPLVALVKELLDEFIQKRKQEQKLASIEQARKEKDDR